uniref:Uncharacterized protein n=1 Tax=Oryza barthii TaxID=65489 RepID=A0A0D3H8B0_9ORYZ
MQWRPSAHHKLFPGDTFVLILGPYLAAVLLVALEEHMKFTAISCGFSRISVGLKFENSEMRGRKKVSKEKRKAGSVAPSAFVGEPTRDKNMATLRRVWEGGLSRHKVLKKVGIGGDTVGFDTGWAAKKQPLVLQPWPGGSSSRG